MSTKANKPEVLAAHLETQVWNDRHLPPVSDTPIFPPSPIDTSPSTKQELMTALALLQIRKPPGTDQLRAEIWTYAPIAVHKALLEHFNKAFSEATSPGSWKVADIVMMFQRQEKGSHFSCELSPHLFNQYGI